jgi:hypothetical protein
MNGWTPGSEKKDKKRQKNKKNELILFKVFL